MLKHCALALSVMLGVGTLSASFHPSPGEWALEADFLYSLPSVDDTYFVLNASASTNSPDGKRENNDFNFHPGFRVGLACGLCDCHQELQLYYSRLGCKETKTVSGSFLWATIGSGEVFGGDFNNYTGSASSDLSLLYQRLDAFFTQRAMCCCGMDLYLQGGLECAYMRLQEAIEYLIPATPRVGSVNQKSRTWGIGPQLGIEFDYAICQVSCCCPGALSFVAGASGSILASESYEKTLITNTGVSPLNVSSDPTWRLIRAAHARLGLNYATCFSCWGASAEIGYEFNTYSRMLTRLSFPDDVFDGQSFTNYYDFDVQGLYVAFNAAF
ncbi:MAG: hypothetical protein HY324_01900 [Chlamydiia bacterium]|nr:hypothetical protein [Chlamydiia bacterium]